MFDEVNVGKLHVIDYKYMWYHTSDSLSCLDFNCGYLVLICWCIFDDLFISLSNNSISILFLMFYLAFNFICHLLSTILTDNDHYVFIWFLYLYWSLNYIFNHSVVSNGRFHGYRELRWVVNKHGIQMKRRIKDQIHEPKLVAIGLIYVLQCIIGYHIL